MNELIAKIYSNTPKFLIKSLRGKHKFRSIKDFLLKKNGQYKKIQVHISRSYHAHDVDFKFIAPIKIALKAKRRGVENTLLRNSFELLSTYNKDKNTVILDVGANFGFLSMVWGQALSANDGVIYSFEPNPFVSQTFHETIVQNKRSNIHLSKIAVGDMNGKIDLFYNGASSNIESKDSMTDKPVNVEITSLDKFTETKQINRVDMIKIDVDGIEFDILHGAERLLENNKPILIVETNDDGRILDYLRSLGYIILDMKLKKVSENSPIPHNIFGVHDSIYVDI